MSAQNTINLAAANTLFRMPEHVEFFVCVDNKGIFKPLVHACPARVSFSDMRLAVRRILNNDIFSLGLMSVRIAIRTETVKFADLHA